MSRSTKAEKARAALLAVLLLPLSACATAADEKTAAPPCTAPEYRQFDFWLGDWEVTTPDGNFAGRNRVEKIEGPCAIQENWTGAKGGTGRSLNTWDSHVKRWHQTWVDAHGTLLQLDGGLQDGSMVLGGEHKGQKHRVTWTPQKDGSVSQHWERSEDGKSWVTVFHGIYRKVVGETSRPD